MAYALPLTVADWILKCCQVAINFWLIFAMYRSGEVKKIFIFLMIYFLIIHDCLAGIISIFHDIPSYFTKDSILIDYPIPYELCVFILCIQWFFHLLFLPVFSLMHFFALFFPFAFRKIKTQFIIAIIAILYIATLILMFPLFTPWCGFIWHSNGKYWASDETKPHDSVYLTADYWLQFICLATMITANIAIILKLYSFRRKHPSQQVVAISSSSRGGNEQSYESSRRTTISPEARLAISFIMLSGCFFASTLSFNFLLGTTNQFFGAVRLICSYMNAFKWIIYCLGNVKIRKAFMSPSMVCRI